MFTVTPEFQQKLRAYRISIEEYSRSGHSVYRKNDLYSVIKNQYHVKTMLKKTTKIKEGIGVFKSKFSLVEES